MKLKWSNRARDPHYIVAVVNAPFENHRWKATIELIKALKKNYEFNEYVTMMCIPMHIAHV